MATWYVNSAATGTGAGTSWANACTTLAAAITLSAAGDDFNVLSTHTETFGVATTFTFKGTSPLPNRVFSCTNTHAPAQDSDLLAGASLSTTTANNLSITGNVYMYGFNLTVGSGSSGATLSLSSGGGHETFDTCAISLPGTASSFLQIGAASASTDVLLTNTTLSFGAVGSGIKATGSFTWIGGGYVGVTVPGNLFAPLNNASWVICDSVDLHLLVGASTLVFGSTSPRQSYTFINCRLSATLLAVSATPNNAASHFVFLVNSDSAVNYRLEKYDYPGTQTTNAVNVKTALPGASDGTTPVSHRVVTNANANRANPFQMIDIMAWVDTTGSSKTATIEVLTDNVILINTDIWVEAYYLGNASFPQASIAQSGTGLRINTGANLATSTGGTAGAAATWVTTGFTSGGANAKPQSMSVTFVTQMKGLVRFKVKVAKPSLTVYVDPYPTIA